MENVMLAPHNANSSPAAWEHVHWNTIRNLLDGLEIPFKIDELNYVGK
jgi:D-3-phosphoglycerate dehydrogenase